MCKTDKQHTIMHPVRHFYTATKVISFDRESVKSLVLKTFIARDCRAKGHALKKKKKD